MDCEALHYSGKRPAKCHVPKNLPPDQFWEKDVWRSSLDEVSPRELVKRGKELVIQVGTNASDG